MKRIELLVTTLILATILAGCSKSVENTNSDTKIEQQTKKVTSKLVEKDTEQSANTEIVDEFLRGNSYTDLVKKESLLDNIVNMVDTVKLREPLKAKEGIIPQSPPKRALAKKPSVEDTGEPTNDKSVKVENHADATIEKIDNIDNNLKPAELPEHLMFLYTINSYVKKELIDNGYLQIYSAQNENADVTSYMNRLRMQNEALEYKNYQIRELFKDDEELINAWNSCYNQLIKAQNTLDKMTDNQSLLVYNKEIDIESLNICYKKFESKTGKYLINFVPYVGKPPIKE